MNLVHVALGRMVTRAHSCPRAAGIEMASAAHRVCAMLLLRRRKRRHFDRTACTTSPPVVQNATPETLETTILQSLIEWEGGDGWLAAKTVLQRKNAWVG